jgi:hypothetical protein
LEVEVRADGVAEGEGGEATDERFGMVEGLAIRGRGDECVIVLVSVSEDLGGKEGAWAV